MTNETSGTANGITATDIRRYEDQRYEAMVTADVEALDRLLDSALVYTHSNGLVDTKKSYIEGVQSKNFDYREIARTEETILTRGDHALVFNRCRMDIRLGGTPKVLDNRVLAVWSKGEDDRWRFVAVHSTPAR